MWNKNPLWENASSVAGFKLKVSTFLTLLISVYTFDFFFVYIRRSIGRLEFPPRMVLRGFFPFQHILT